jgi:uncharacterized low-complexity protein
MKINMGLIAGASVVLAMLPQAHAAGNPFGIAHADGAMLVVADAGRKKGISVLEGKCGSGKCGTQRVRQMMDRKADGQINREEYVSWAGAQAGNEFDEIAKGRAAVGADDVFKHFQSLEYHNQGRYRCVSRKSRIRRGAAFLFAPAMWSGRERQSGRALLRRAKGWGARARLAHALIIPRSCKVKSGISL